MKLCAKIWHMEVNSHYTSLSAILDVTSEFSDSEGGTKSFPYLMISEAMDVLGELFVNHPVLHERGVVISGKRDHSPTKIINNARDFHSKIIT